MMTKISDVPEGVIIDWLGSFPEHWQVKRIKDVFGGFGSGTTPQPLIQDIMKMETFPG